MNYRRSTRAQSQRLAFLAVYILLSSVAAWSATTKHTIGNGPVTAVTATAEPVCAS
jgi:hypothetical protein